jgi:hypothetical protein
MSENISRIYSSSKKSAYQFSIKLAEFYGVKEAIILNHLLYWVSHNQSKRSKAHYRDGKYWTYLSIHDLQITFPFWTERQIRTIMNSLVTKGAAIKGDYGRKLYYRATWYTVDEGNIKSKYELNNKKKNDGKNHSSSDIKNNEYNYQLGNKQKRQEKRTFN